MLLLISEITSTNTQVSEYRIVGWCVESSKVNLISMAVEPVTAFDSRPKGPGFETPLGQLVFTLGKEINLHCLLAQFAQL